MIFLKKVVKKQKKVKKDTELDIAKKALNKATKTIELSGLRDFTQYLNSPYKLIVTNFLAGTARGLGFFVGASIVLAVFAAAVTRILVNVPILGEFFSALLSFLQENTHFTGG